MSVSNGSNSLTEIAFTDMPFNLATARFSLLETTVFLSFVLPIITFTITSNVFVIFAVVNYAPLKTPSNLFLLSLAVTDLIFGAVVMPVACFYNIVGVWHFGTIGCKAWTFLSFFSTTSSIFHLCAIAIDRYRAIAQPLHYASKRTCHKSMIIVAVVWVCSFIIVSPPFITGWGIDWPDEFHTNTPCTIPQDPSYAIYASVGSFYFPLLIILVVYIKLFVIGRKRFRKKMKRASEMIEVAEASSNARAATVHVKATTVGQVSNGALTVETDNHAVQSESESPPSVEFHMNEVNNGVAITKYLVEGSKRRHLLAKVNVELSIRKCSKPTLTGKCRKCQAGISRRRVRGHDQLCAMCSGPNNLVVAAERSRLAILVQRERRSVFIISVLVCTFIVCWMPGFTFFWVMAVWPKLDVDPWVITIVWWLAYTNSACNPIIYTIFNRDFKDAFYKLVLRRK